MTNAFVNFFAEDLDVRRRCDAEPHINAIDTGNDDLDVVADPQGFADMAV